MELMLAYCSKEFSRTIFQKGWGGKCITVDLNVGCWLREINENVTPLVDVNINLHPSLHVILLYVLSQRKVIDL